jgi:hypothetical protein
MAELSRMGRLAGFGTTFVGLAAATALGGTGGCSSNGATGTANSDDGGMSIDSSIGCATDPRGEKFMLNMSHKGDSGMLSFVIVKANFNPPAVANNTWTVKILDANGQPVNDASLTFPRDGHPSDPWMPDHSHGALPAQATNNMDGTYTITPLDFFMGGIWATYIQAQVGSVTDTDHTTFMFCIGS